MKDYYKNYGREIFGGERLAAQTIADDSSLFANARAVGFAGRIVSVLNLTDGLPLEEIERRLKAHT